MVDVTSLVRAKVNAAPAGDMLFQETESESASVDGAILSLIFNDPAVTSDRSVALLFGATKPTGDQFRLEMSRPVNPSDPSAVLEMSLGISFGYQGGTQQYSTVDVNGRRLTSAAGGQDDGENSNGALITVGGAGDVASNPSDPNAMPLSPRDDDERYNLLPFISNGDRAIVVDTANPSNDDNILFAAFVANPPISSVVVEDGAQYVAIGDSYSSGEGTWVYDQGRAGRNCHRGSGAWPRLLEASARSLTTIVLRACSGASTGDLYYNFKEGGVQIGGQEVQPDVDLVTLTIGGNDMDFKHKLELCVALSCTHIDSSSAFKKDLEVLKTRLRTVYRSLRRIYPNARIVHVGYPRIFPDPSKEPWRCAWMSHGEQVAGDQMARGLNTAIRQAVSLSREQIEYVDIFNVFQGRELCTSNPVVEDLTIFGGDERGHPNVEGQQLIAAMVKSKLNLR